MGGSKIRKMRKRLPILLIFIACLLAGIPLRSAAQKLDHFSGDSTKFIGELHIVFSNLAGNELKMTEKLMEDFIQLWNREQFDPSKKKIIYQIGNLMLKKKVRAYPDFYNFIRALDVFENANQPDEAFFEWTSILKDLVGGKSTRHFSAFLETSVDLFSESLVYRSSTTRWRIATPVYKFKKDTVPVIVFGKTDLVCMAANDSLRILGTKGVYYPLTNLWIGKGGRVDWRRTGLDPEKVYADIDNYQIQMKFSKVDADSAVFYNRNYFTSPLLGHFSDKVLSDVPDEKASYPRFESYDKEIPIHNLFRDIDFLGGFAMEGAKVVGSGTAENDARLDFKKDDRNFVTVRSKTFIIRPDRINSGKASITIYHEQDSIHHPGLQMKYIDEKRELTLTRDERESIISPWFDSWHKIEIYCEELSWKMNEPKIDFAMERGPNVEGKATFESSNYYSQQRYERLQGLDEFNPLYVIKKYLEPTKSTEFNLDGLAAYMKKPPLQVESLILGLTRYGFLIYDFDSKTARVNAKLFDFVKAKNGKTDYDVIVFNSEVKGMGNGRLNLENFDLLLQGVNKVFLSDSQQVSIIPAHREIILKKDRDFLFSGKVEAGLFDFFAKDCSFEYEKFKLNMPDIDSMAFYVRSRTKDPKTQQYPLVRVRTLINGLSGDLLIDDPKNKSGLKKFPQYPVFTSKNDAHVNWEKQNIQNGVYKKDKFYYTVAPFTLRSLGRIPTDSLQFRGVLTSAGIFPDINQPLVLRPDYSMGIEKMTPQSGLPVYGGKGVFFSKIDLSNAGLRGSGKVSYLQSMSLSDNFIFYPDTMKTLAKSFTENELTGPVEYPTVKGDSLNEVWYPHRDSMVVQTTRKDVSMYRDQAHFGGQLSLTPHGLNGDGTIRIKDAEMDSRLFFFRQHVFDANIANFRIKAYNLADLSISTKNYQTHFDFDTRKGEFKSNVGISRVEFPFNQYVCSMDRFDWLIDHEEIALFNEHSQKLAIADTMSPSRLIDFDFGGSEFISVRPDQDSLRFFAFSARYNLKSNIIYCQDVRIVKVADAAIFPDSGKVCIQKTAKLRPLSRALMVANTTSKYHSFYNSEVTINSRKRYVAAGNYDYIDPNGKHEQIRFNRISQDTTGETYAKGSIPDSSDFRLNPEIAYTGDVIIRAGRKELEFDGGFHPLTECFPNNPSWVQFKSTISPSNVQIPLVDPLHDQNHERLSLGILFSNRTNRIYPAFFSRRETFSDSVMISAGGLMDYKPSSGEFRISTQERLANPGAKDNFISLNTANCLFHAEGKISLGMNSGPLKMEAYGNMDHYVIPDSTQVNVAIGFDFPFSENAAEKLVTQLGSINLNGILVYNTPYLVAMKTFLEKKDFDKLKSEMELTGKFKKFPDELNRTLFLAEVHMSWDSVNKAWISHGPIGIGNIQKNQVNRYVKGIVEFDKKRAGDEFTMYFELTKDDWYFFNFRNNILQVLSSNLPFNDQITDAMKSKSEQNRIDHLAKGYRYVISTERKKRDFLRKFETGDE
jgi:hypothetical protein